MLKLIHAADLHLDSPFSGLSPEAAALRRRELRELPDRLADLAVREGADLVLLAGDLLDGGQVYRETTEALARALGRIPCPVFLAPGNHDPYTAPSPYALPIWPDNVHIFSSPAVEGMELPGLGCTVYGAAFTDEQREDPPLAGFSAQGDGLRLMVLHGNTEGAGYGPVSPADIAASGLDYLALGHIHQASGLQLSGGTWWAYPGCPEGRGFDELGDKGALVVEVEPGRVKARFASLCRRRYEILDVDLTGAQDALAAAEAALPARTADHSFRLRLTGEFPADSTLADRLTQALASRFFSLEVQDLTRPPRDLWARAGEDSLTGLFLQEMAQFPSGPDRELALRFGLSALEQGEDVAP